MKAHQLPIQPPEALFIDLDGTLGNTLPFLYQTYLSVLKKRGVEGSWEEFERLNGPSLAEIMDYFRRTYGFRDSNEEFERDYLSTLHSLYGRGDLTFPLARDFLEIARKWGAMIAVVTSGRRILAERFFEAEGLREFIDDLVTSEDVHRAKPDPALYTLALSRSGKKADGSLVIEDSLHGAQAGRAAGIPTVHLGVDLEWGDLVEWGRRFG